MQLPDLLPLSTGSSSLSVSVFTSTPLEPERDAEGKCKLLGWPLPNGRPPAIHYKDTIPVGWECREFGSFETC